MKSVLFSIAVTEDGGVYSCGWGADGQTGLGHYNNVSEFTRLQGDIADERIVQVSGRCDFVIALNGTWYRANILLLFSLATNTKTYLLLL